MSRSLTAKNRERKKVFDRNLLRPQLETLEDRVTPSGNTISGFVYYDANSNGLFDPGEAPIANSQIQLFNSNNQLVGTTTTDAQGHYQFTTDQSTPTIDETLTKTVSFGPTQTNFNLNSVLQQFDPSLGQLVSVEIQHGGSITSEIQVENFSQDSTSDISGTVSGTLNLTAPGVNNTLAISGYAGSFQAGVYDGVTDFAGTSGTSFGQKTASGSNTITLTGDDINAYIGTGTVNLAESAVATSNATGGGNLDVRVRSTGASTITVIYHYKAFGPLQPGSYKIVQTQEPPGYIDGLESQNGVVIPNTIGTDFINVGLVNSDVPNNNFGELKTTSLSGHVYFDANNNGQRDGADFPIAGVTIALDGNGQHFTTTTDANGFYQFNNLTPGTYTVSEVQPAGYLNGTDTPGSNGGTVVLDATHEQIGNIVLNSGDGAINYDFGEVKPASLSGHVYYDTNNNGQRDPGDTPIAGVIMTLDGTGVHETTTTDTNGFYQFNNLTPGSYTVSETQPAGFINGTDTPGTDGGTVLINATQEQINSIGLNANDNAQNYDFGEVKQANLTGHVYYDANNNGQRDPGDFPIAGVTMTLTGPGGQQTTVTDANGYYHFDNLVPGTYTVSETQPAGYINGTDTPGTNGGTVLIDATHEQINSIALNANQSAQNYDFGEVKQGTLSGHVYYDANNNGQRDPGDSPIAGVTMTLTGPGGQQTATTDLNGFYQFTNLAPGTYTISETQPAGYANGTDTPGTDGGTVLIDATHEQINSINLNANDNAQNYDFGEVKQANLSGHVYYDANNNGQRDPGDSPIAGVTMTLTGPGGQQTTVTDANGYYHFDNLVPGTYTVSETQPAGYINGTDTPGTNGGTVLIDATHEQINSIALNANQSAQNYDFGEVKQGTLSGHVYYDANNNGQRDPGDSPIAGVTMTLTGPGGQQTATTDLNGFYQFTNLAPGTYTISETQPAGYANGTDTPGTDGGTVLIDATHEQINSINLNANDNAQNYDFGEVKQASLSGHVYYDVNNNGQRDPGDPPIAGVTITLNGPGGSQTTTTDANGFYQFNNLTAGTYIVSETQPAGYINGTDTSGTDGGTVLIDATHEQINSINVKTSDNALNYDFGEVKPASLSGHVYYDINKNGQRDPGDPAIPGVTITLNGPGGVQTTTTDANGFYQFSNLAPGTYSVAETQPAGYQNGTDTAGTDGGTVLLDATHEEIDSIAVNSGDSAQNYDFGEVQQASLSGHVYYDANDNGQRDATDPPIAGVTMTLTGPGGQQTTTTTDANGFYQFNNLAPGTYTVAETQPAGYLNGTDTAGTKGGTVVLDATHEQITGITLGANDNAQNYDFGEVKPASLAGNVYYDANNNGQLDPGEAPIPGTTVTLTGFADNGPVSMTTTTASDGTYSFANLRPGTYALTETQPTGYDQGHTTVGSQGGTLGTDVISDIDLVAGTNGTNNNFGEIKPTVPDTPLPKTSNPFSLSLPGISKSQMETGYSNIGIPAQLRSDMAFYMGASFTLLGVAPSPLQTLQGALSLEHGLSRTALVTQLSNTVAHQALEVNTLYQSLLNRAPTSQELAAGIATLKGTGGQIAVAESILVSTAYQQLHPTSDDLVAALYKDILNMVPGTTSTQNLLQSMDSQPLSQVVSSLLNSTASLGNLVDSTYREVLHRAATPAEIQTWTAQLQANTITLDQLAQRLLTSQEFYQLTFTQIT